MKKVFVPNMDDLCKMQSKHINMLPYLYAKAVERLCIEYNNYPRRGSILRDEYKYLRENPIIANAICRMYPKEVNYSEIAKYDVGLAMKLITYPESFDIYRLNNLSEFSDSTNNNLLIQKEVIRILYEEINDNPKYRFEYKNSKILDDIFMGKFDMTCIPDNMKYYLSCIEPYYGINLCDSDTLRNCMKFYVSKYGINYENDNVDILTNQSTEVKRLFKCINKK